MSKRAQRRRKGQRKEQAKRDVLSQAKVWRKLTSTKKPRRGHLVSPGVTVSTVDVSFFIPNSVSDMTIKGCIYRG